MTVAYCREEETGVGHARQWRQRSEEACEQDTGSERMRRSGTAKSRGLSLADVFERVCVV